MHFHALSRTNFHFWSWKRHFRVDEYLKCLAVLAVAKQRWSEAATKANPACFPGNGTSRSFT